MQQIQRGCLEQNTKDVMDHLSEAKVWIIFCAELKQKQWQFLVVWSALTLFYSSYRWRPWGLAQVAPPSGHLRQAGRSCRQVALTAHSWDSEYVLHMQPHVPNKHIHTLLYWVVYSQEPGRGITFASFESGMSRKTRRHTSDGLRWV